MLSEKFRRAVCSQVAIILREERERLGISMTSLAGRAGLSQQMISYVEREMRNPTLDTLLRITDVLGIELSEVVAQAERRANSGSAK
jgi:transcriptional regulator with XRE-family HTH domain